MKVIIDASEQEIPRPKDKRKMHYSGKRKRHTVKNQYAVNRDGEIVHKPSHSPGRPHDYFILKKKIPVLPEGLRTFADLGYRWMKKDFPQINPVLPYKRRKGRRLTPEQKEFNRNHSRIRIVVEHTISKIKKFCIMRETFRNRLRRHDGISD
ncbi:MAG: transposase [Thaumarchaeota archaeon]|nr:transposase [Nitrososphaerota archaeon]